MMGARRQASAVARRPSGGRRPDPRDPVQWLASGFGVGLIPWAPGTFGTLVGLPLAWAATALAPPVFGLLVAVLFAAGVWLCELTGRRCGVSDHPAIVWDEMVGVLIAASATGGSWQALLAAFLLFRFFDILKPGPIGWLDRHLHGGLGVMLDDAAAGVVSAGLLVLWQQLPWPWMAGGS